MTPPRVNPLGQPIGPSVGDWQPPPWPPRTVLKGRYCRLEPLDPERHGSDLWTVFAEDAEGRGWTYMPYGPFADELSFRQWLLDTCCGDDPLFFAIVEPQNGQAVGVASYLRITPRHGVVEVGHLHFSRRIQRSPVTTEAMVLMMRQAFSLGYRRYEWKCDALNAPSRAAAQRLGFHYEGTFRQHVVYKGRSRDTAWFAITDADWRELEPVFERWLAPENFGPEGAQKTRLSDMTAGLSPN
ncbi:MAG: GNAT family protein [Marinobacter sp.]|uniref:GNAT family N-acetyltransferase n=1 Tax=Marinobacter sp. TaxID=50741 RepID=UPI00299DCC49|nr:GNAT family protein [Marinobacter sp.]MDX1757187.1 GNAT family protein [Marinobacter sp.]